MNYTFTLNTLARRCKVRTHNKSVCRHYIGSIQRDSNRQAPNICAQPSLRGIAKSELRLGSSLPHSSLFNLSGKKLKFSVPDYKNDQNYWNHYRNKFIAQTSGQILMFILFDQYYIFFYFS